MSLEGLALNFCYNLGVQISFCVVIFMCQLHMKFSTVLFVYVISQPNWNVGLFQFG
jgi:hypothetical protein